MSIRSRAFSLLEVVAAVGVFALGIIVVIGLFAPLARSVGSNADAEAAARISDAIHAELTQRVAHARSFAPVAALLKDAAALPAGGDPRGDGQLLFVSRDGAKIGGYNAAAWEGSDREKFFEVAFMRNAELSPPSVDANAAMLVYTARIRWPALSTAQETLFVNGAIRR